jgi:ATP-dependent protease ClpP protease subunit
MKVLLILIMMLLSFSVIAKTPPTKTIVLSEDNTLILNEEFNSDSIGQLMVEAAKLNASLKSGYPMYLYLYTPGGEIQSGLEFYDFASGLNRPIHTITSFAASMGFQTVQQLGERYMLSSGILMSHKARGSVSGEFSDGAAQLDSRYSLWLQVIYDLDMKTVERTKGKQTLKSYRADYENEMWLLGKRAVERGYADAVVTVSCDATLKGKTYDKKFQFMMFTVNVTFDRCPLNQNPLSITVEIATSDGMMKLTDFINKGGHFGTNCPTTDTYYSSYSSPTTKPVLCTLDPKLTLEEINKTVEEKRQYYTRNLTNSIKKSY